MLCRWELHGVLVALLLIVSPLHVSAQDEDLGLIGEFVADETGDEEEVTQEVTVSIEKDGKTLTVTQTVEGEFVGEVVEGNETTPIRAKSLEELKEKFPDAHAAFHAKPAAAQAKDQVDRSSVTVNADERRLEIQTPGRKFVSLDHQGKDLEITVKQNLEHGTRTERYEAEDLATLRKKFPKIAQEFQTHAAANGGLVIRMPAGARFGVNPVVPGPRKFIGEHQGRKVRILDEQGKNIRMTITKTENGKETTEEFQAEDLDDLKQKDPDIAKIYEKFAGKGAPPTPQPFGLVNGNVQIQVRNPAAALPAADPTRRLQAVHRMLDSSRKQLERLAQDGKHPDADALKKLAENIADITKQLEALETKK